MVCFNNKSQRFIFENEDSFEEEEIEEFLSKFSKNELKPNYKSEAEPKDNSNKLIKIIIGKTIESFLEQNESKDVLIYFYSNRNCEKCADFEIIYSNLASHYVKNTNIIFGKFNLDVNEFPRVFDIKKVPALFIRRSNTTEPTLLEYNEKSTLNDYISLIDGPKMEAEVESTAEV